MPHYKGVISFAPLRQDIDEIKLRKQRDQVKPSHLDLSQEIVEVQKKADQLIEEVRKDAENARIKDEQAKKEAEAIRNDVDRKVTQSNAT
ncbi:Translation initiation factor IF-2 [Bienertia sinuspersici]